MPQPIRSLPSPYYRVTSRAIILDERMRILVIENEDGSYELPGGGWEHKESFEDCIRREIKEELGVKVLWIGHLWFYYRGRRKAWPWHLRLCAPVQLESYEFKLGPGIKQAHFVTKQVFLNTTFSSDEQPIKDHADEIWPPAKPDE